MIAMNIFTPVQIAGEITLLFHPDGHYYPKSQSDAAWCQELVGTDKITDVDTLADIASDHGLGLAFPRHSIAREDVI